MGHLCAALMEGHDLELQKLLHKLGLLPLCHQFHATFKVGSWLTCCQAPLSL